MSPVQDELAARLAYGKLVQEAEAKLRVILRTYRTRSSARGQNTLWGMRGPQVRKARSEVEYLLKQEPKRSGLTSPSVYGPEIQRRAEAARDSLKEVPMTTRMRRAQVPDVIGELSEIIDSLDRGQQEIEAAQTGDAAEVSG